MADNFYVPRLLATSEAAALLGISEEVVIRRCEFKIIRAIKFQGCYRIPETEIKHFKPTPENR